MACQGARTAAICSREIIFQTKHPRTDLQLFFLATLLFLAMRYRPFVEIPNDYYGSTELLSFRRNCSRTDLSPDHQREFCWKGHQCLSQHQQQMTTKPIHLQKKQMQMMQTSDSHTSSKLLLGDLWCLNKSSKPPQDLSSKGNSRLPWELPSATGLSHLQCLFGEATHPGSGWSYEGWNLMNSLLLPAISHSYNVMDDKWWQWPIDRWLIYVWL